MTRRFWTAALTLGALFAATSAGAQEMAMMSWGFRGGFRLGQNDFDQVVLGAQANLGEVSTNVRFEPNVQVGLGSEVTIVSIDPELQYIFRDQPVADRTFFYAGGGLGIHIVKTDAGGRGIGDSDTQLKINVSAGVEKELSSSTGVFGEARVSFIDGTWIDFLAGFNFLR